MKKYVLGILLACLLSLNMLAQVRYFEWIDPATTLRVKIKPDTHELWKEIRVGEWVKSNTVKFDANILEGLPKEFGIHSAFYRGDSVVTFTVHGMGNVYVFDTKKMILERLDHCFYKGYNFGSFEFMRKDTLFSFGGYGFWNFNNTQTFFDKKNNEWTAYRSKNFGPKSIKAGINGYDAKRDVFYSGWNLDEDLLIDGERKNNSSFYSFDFKTKEWTRLGELNAVIQFFNTEQDLYWNGTYFMGWNAKELYLIDPTKNKVYSNKEIKNVFDVLGKFYTKGDTFIYYSSNGYTSYTYSIKKLLQDSEYVGPLYTSGMSTSGYVGIGLGILLLGGLGLFLITKYSKRKQTDFFTEQEKNLLTAFLQSGSLTTITMNNVLGTHIKGLDNQRRIRSIAIKQLNQKLFDAYGVQKGIEKHTDVNDKRLTSYCLRKGLAEKLEINR
jgi:hypothetical protein